MIAVEFCSGLLVLIICIGEIHEILQEAAKGHVAVLESNVLA